MNKKSSTALYKRAQELIPGGVNSPVRACRSVGMDPLFIDHADGCRLFDADGNAFIDYIGSWGPMILGHRHPSVIAAISSALEKGTSFGAPTELEIELAELIVEAVPSVEMVRMVNSGTEATMSAIRLARGLPAGIRSSNSTVATTGMPILCWWRRAPVSLPCKFPAVRVPATFVAHTLSLPYNDIDTVKKVMAEKGDQDCLHHC
jgi:glutamate-1-semialdehyde 2,1-aminomutase